MRTKRANYARKKKKKFLKNAKGYRGSLSRRYKLAKQQYFRSGNSEYKGRKERKRNFKRLWIQRINAAARNEGIKYSEFINGLKKSDIKINRKMLADLAVNDPDTFKEYVDIAKETLASS